MKKILGLDLGTNSIGWALVEVDHENKTVRILGLGSRILNMDAAEIAKFESGSKIESAAAQRTAKRSPRKLNERYILRRDRLHCVLNLLNALPEQYKISIEFENGKGKRSGKFKNGREEKLAYYKDEKGFSKFLFQDAYVQMEAEFKTRHPELFYQKKNGKQTQIPFDWTLYYLRHHAVTNPDFELTKEQLAWVTLSFNQKRGYEKVIGQDEQKQNEKIRIDKFIGKVNSIDSSNHNRYKIKLVSVDDENSILLEYYENSIIQITELGDLKELEIITKYDEELNIKNNETVYRIKELKSLVIEDVKFTEKSNEIMYTLNTGWSFTENKKYLPKITKESKDFIVETDYDSVGERLQKSAGNKGKIDVKIETPSEDDWTLMKLKTETSLVNFNTKNKTVGIASFVYYNLLQNPKQKIKGDLITVIERDFYKEEIEKIYRNQEKFHPELKNRELYKQAIQLLYPNNLSHQNNIKELSFGDFISKDILFYQRDLKSKKSLISDCAYESREYWDKETNQLISAPIKVIHKNNPYYQEFRLWQFIKRLKIIKLADIIDGENKFNIDNSKQLLTKDTQEHLFEYLNDKDNVTEKNILDFLSKFYKDKSIKQENYKWNFTSEKEPCNTTRYEFILRTKQIKDFDYKTFLSFENEYKLWHFFYSVKRKDEFKKGINSLFTQLLENAGISLDFLPELVKNFSSFRGYSNDYGTYSEKAIKKLLPFLRIGKYWNEKSIEEILAKRTIDVKTKADEIVREKVLDKEEINGESKDFQGLWVSSACYLVYGRYSEVGDVQYWKTPHDIEQFLKNEFRQHSLNNPVVEKVLIETLHIVKDIWDFFGKSNENYFDRIHIEMGREMKKNNKQKERDDKINKENRKANDRIVEILKELKKENAALEVKSPFQQEKLRILEEGLLSSIEYDKDTTEYKLENGKISKKQIKEITSKEFAKISKSDFERYKLWLDQRYQSPYTGKFIKLSDLFDRKKYEIEHVFPQERITLNSLSNKVICETEVNKEKRANTGYGFIVNAKEKEIFCSAHNDKIKILSVADYEEIVKSNFTGKKQEILLSKDIPEDFTNSQEKNMQYIAKMAMKLLSNVVREDGEDAYRSKNILPTNGNITSTLKRHWKLNDTWNEIIKPRFKRLNQLTNSNLFGYNRLVNGHEVFINTVPEETAAKFEPKRIDHRHHALDALIIALTTEEHVQYLNNISSQNEDDDKKLETRKGLKYLLTNSRKGFNDEKEWYFLPPAQTKRKNEIVEFEYYFQESKGKIFKDIAKLALENTVTSFKLKNRVIRQRWNKYQVLEDGKIDLKTEENLNLKSNFNIRKQLHLDTFYGKVKLQNNDKDKKNVIEIDVNKAIEERYDILDSNISIKVEELKCLDKAQSEIIDIISKEFPKVKVYEKFVASRYGNELTSLANITSDKIQKAIDSITDIGIRKILENHIKNYQNKFDEEGKAITPQTLAFSPEGIKELNENIVELNGGKRHQPIYKVRMKDAMGKRFFTVSEEILDAKNKKYAATADGSNAFCGIYQNEMDRKYYVPTLRESVASLKDGYEPCPQTHPEDPDYKLLFVLNPSDLVYVPTKEEIEDDSLIDWNSLSKERIYKFRDGSINSKGVVQYNFMPSNWAGMIFKDNKDIGEIPLSKGGYLKGEVTITSDKDKSQNDLLDGMQIRAVCWKIKIDRLGNILKVI